jgi:hypothetical protein
LCEAPPPAIPSLRASSPYWSYTSRFSGSLSTSYAWEISLNYIYRKHSTLLDLIPIEK